MLGLATGRTMVGVYRALLAQDANLTRATTFNLDEYCDLPAEHPASFRAFMTEHLFAPAKLPDERTNFPETHHGAGDDYEVTIAEAGGVDLQLLGIGRNGHIGFNEPGSAMTSRRRIVELSTATRTANAPQLHGDDVPRRAATMGIATILDARSNLLLATSEAKADALATALKGPATPSCPASFLSRHPDVTVIADRAVASRLSQPVAAQHEEPG